MKLGGGTVPVELPPGGETLEIVHGDQRALVTTSGATLRVYEAGGRPIIEAFDGPDAEIIGCQGEILAPWPNRVVGGRWTWNGTTYQLSISEPERGHALHGLVRNLAWQVVEHDNNRVQLEVLLLAHPGWPFPLHCDVSYALGPDGLRSTIRATNVGRRVCPYGIAVHPYLALQGSSVDEAVVRIPAATWLEVDERLAPRERLDTAGSSFDFRSGARVGPRKVDNAFTDLAPAPGGKVEATVTTPDGHTTVLWGDSSVRWWQLFTGDVLPDPWKRKALTVEPMTCGPDALNSGEDLILLEPGASSSMTWGLTGG